MNMPNGKLKCLGEECRDLVKYCVASGATDETKRTLEGVKSEFVKLTIDQKRIADVNLEDERLPESFVRNCKEVKELSKSIDVEDYRAMTASCDLKEENELESVLEVSQAALDQQRERSLQEIPNPTRSENEWMNANPTKEEISDQTHCYELAEIIYNMIKGFDG